MHRPIAYMSKPRTVKIVVQTSQDISIWVDEFSFDSPIERIKEDFLNHHYLRSYLEKNGSMKLLGMITVSEPEWKSTNDSTALVENQFEKLITDFGSLLSTKTLSDFKFQVEEKEFDVHKAILAGE
jgi:hypothetical protein